MEQRVLNQNDMYFKMTKLSTFLVLEVAGLPVETLTIEIVKM